MGEGQVADEAVLGVERDVGGFYLEEAVGVVEELDHVFADGCAEGGGPAVFVGAVGGDKEDEVDLVFPEQQGVAVEEAVFEVFVGLGFPVRRTE